MFIIGDSYTVTRVVITNRADCCEDRALDTRVGVTYIPPVAGADIQPDSYTLCAEKQGTQNIILHVLDQALCFIFVAYPYPTFLFFISIPFHSILNQC